MINDIAKTIKGPLINEGWCLHRNETTTFHNKEYPYFGNA